MNTDGLMNNCQPLLLIPTVTSHGRCTKCIGTSAQHARCHAAVDGSQVPGEPPVLTPRALKSGSKVLKLGGHARCDAAVDGGEVLGEPLVLIRRHEAEQRAGQAPAGARVAGRVVVAQLRTSAESLGREF